MSCIRTLTFLVLLFALVDISQQFWKKDCSGWSKPDYSKCRFGLPCDPKQANPCGCSDMCCAFKPKPWWKGKLPVIHGRKRRGTGFELEELNDQDGSYWCHKKGECHDRCGSVLGESHVKKCGCGAGLTCRKDHWYQIKRCRLD